MVAWDRKETSLSAEEVYTDTSPGLWESLAPDLEAPEDLGAPLTQAVDLLQDMVGSGLQAILSGDWHLLLGTVEEAPERVTERHADTCEAEVVPI